MKRRVLNGTAAALAAAYLLAMYVTGVRPTNEQFVAFEAAGIIEVTPEHVRQVDVATPGEKWRLQRQGEAGWLRDGVPLPAALAERLSLAVKFLHTARPVREIATSELDVDDPASGFAEASPVITATLDDGTRVTLAFGSRNPDGSLQYVRAGPPLRIALMSNFVGEEWAAVVSALAARPDETRAP